MCRERASRVAVAVTTRTQQRNLPGGQTAPCPPGRARVPTGRSRAGVHAVRGQVRSVRRSCPRAERRLGRASGRQRRRWRLCHAIARWSCARLRPVTVDNSAVDSRRRRDACPVSARVSCPAHNSSSLHGRRAYSWSNASRCCGPHATINRWPSSRGSLRCTTDESRTTAYNSSPAVSTFPHSPHNSGMDSSTTSVYAHHRHDHHPRDGGRCRHPRTPRRRPGPRRRRRRTVRLLSADRSRTGFR